MKISSVTKTLVPLVLLSTFALVAPAAADVPSQPVFEFEQVATRGLGDFQNSGIWGMQWWQGKLYAGTIRNWYCFSQAWFAINLPDLYNWPPVAPYRCTEDIRDLPLQAEIWRYTPETETWEMVYRSPEVEIPGEPGYFTGRDIGYRSMAVFEEADGTEALYVGGVTANLLWQPMPPPRLLRSVDGTTFEPVPHDPGTLMGELGLDQASFRSFTVYRGRLYLVNGSIQGRGAVLEAEHPAGGNDNFRWITPEGVFVFDMDVFNDWLYLGLYDTKGYSVIKTQATGAPPYEFITVVPQAGNRVLRPSKTVVSMQVFDGRLYVGMDRPCEIVRINPDDSWDLVVGKPRWTQDGYKRPLSGLGDGFSYSLNFHIWRMQEHEGALYFGTYDETVELTALLRPHQDRPVVATLLEYMDPGAGFDLFATTDGHHFTRITTDGFGDMFDQGIRNFSSTPHGLFVAGVNMVDGLMLWRGIPEPSGAAAATPCRKPSPPACLQVERASGSPLLVWEPSTNATGYRVFRSDIASKFSFGEVGDTVSPFFSDTEAGLAADYFVVAEDASCGVSEPSNMVSFPSKNPPVSFLNMSGTFRKWEASVDLETKLFYAGLSTWEGRFGAAFAQLQEMIQAVLLDVSLTPWRAQDAAILLGKLARRVRLAELGVLPKSSVLWGL